MAHRMAAAGPARNRVCRRKRGCIKRGDRLGFCCRITQEEGDMLTRLAAFGMALAFATLAVAFIVR